MLSINEKVLVMFVALSAGIVISHPVSLLKTMFSVIFPVRLLVDINFLFMLSIEIVLFPVVFWSMVFVPLESHV